VQDPREDNEHEAEPATSVGRFGLRTPRRFLAAYFAILLVMVLATVPVFVATIRTLDRQNALYDPASAAVSSLLVGALNQETGARGYTLTGDPGFLQPYNEGATQYGAAVERLRQLDLSPGTTKDLRSAEAAFDRWNALTKQLVADVAAGQYQVARSLSAQTEAKGRFDDFRAQQSRAAQAISADVAASRHALKVDIVLSLVVLLVAFAAGIVLGLFMLTWWRVWGRNSLLQEQRLADRGILVKSAIDSSSESIFAKDLAGRYVLANRARAASLAGGDANVEIIGHNVDEFLDQHTVEAIKRTEEDVLATGETRVLEEVLDQPDGPHTFSVTKNPLYDSEGRIVGIVGVGRDVTEERKLRADLDRLHRSEHEFVGLVQEAMKGNAEIDDDRLRIAARYRPAHDMLSVGGDWYDVVRIDGDRVGLVIGDAVGHGLFSAIAMGQLRSALAALIGSGISPVAALQGLDRFATDIPSATTATCFVAFLDLKDDQLTFSTAGQMPPVIALAGGEPHLVDGFQDHPLAVDTALARHDTTVAFPKGSLIILYTDGLVEDRRLGLIPGLERLLELVRQNIDMPEESLADCLIENLVTGHQEDDVALVVARRPL
jgi:PAS domain S-box-containing protein